jgi:hypothetical protein
MTARWVLAKLPAVAIFSPPAAGWGEAASPDRRPSDAGLTQNNDEMR